MNDAFTSKHTHTCLSFPQLHTNSTRTAILRTKCERCAANDTNMLMLVMEIHGKTAYSSRNSKLSGFSLLFSYNIKNIPWCPLLIFQFGSLHRSVAGAVAVVSIFYSPLTCIYSIYGSFVSGSFDFVNFSSDTLFANQPTSIDYTLDSRLQRIHTPIDMDDVE